MNPKKDWKSKLERVHFFKVRSDRITVCIALKRCKQMVQKSEKTKCDVVCQIHKSCANQETNRRWQVVPSGVIFWKLTYYVVDVGSKNSTRLGCKKRTKN